MALQVDNRTQSVSNRVANDLRCVMVDHLYSDLDKFAFNSKIHIFDLLTINYKPIVDHLQVYYATVV